MVISVGVDLVKIERFQRVFERHRERFLARVFTDGERERCEGGKRPEIHLAARFAAKEAVMKVLGTGWGGGVGWRDVEVVGGGGIRPEIRLWGQAKAHAETLGIKRVLVSLSHDGEYATAFVVATD